MKDDNIDRDPRSPSRRRFLTTSGIALGALAFAPSITMAGRLGMADEHKVPQRSTPKTNVILVLIDSLNRHYLSPYGCTTVRTPNIGELASRGVTFNNHYVGSIPCMPARREMMTGRQEFLYLGWGHIEPFDDVLADRCHEAGAVTQMVTDHYHYWEDGAHGYMEYFNGS
jgi:arylsulfatase A-like enzyme